MQLMAERNSIADAAVCIMMALEEQGILYDRIIVESKQVLIILPDAPAVAQARLTRCDVAVKSLIESSRERMTTSKILSHASENRFKYSDTSIRRSLAKLHKVGQIDNREDSDPPGYGISESDRS